jgi:hypothetical protein
MAESRFLMLPKLIEGARKGNKNLILSKLNLPYHNQ